MEEAVKHKIGVRGLGGITVAIQGLGHVGYDLARRLHNVGAHLIVSDLNKYLTKKANQEFNATIVSTDKIHAQEADIFSPCALGGSINLDTLPDIQAYIIAGAANNQLSDNSIGLKLLKQGILYCPDYVINAGGIINVASEVSGSYDLSWVNSKIDRIRNNLKEVFEKSERSRIPTNEVADSMAKEMLR
jgi:leucine dehydrogenase